MRRIAAFICAAVLVLGLAACSSGKDYSNQTVVGEVTAIDGSKITLNLGEMVEMQGGDQAGAQGDPNGQGAASGQAMSSSGGSEPPEMPSGEAPAAQSGEAPAAQSGEAPEKPSGDAAAAQSGDAPAAQGGDVPEKPSGDAAAAQGGDVPEKPSGDAAAMPSGEAPAAQSGDVPEKPSGDAAAAQGGDVPEKPSGDAPDMQGENGSGMPGGAPQTFEASGESATFNVNELSLDGIEVGDIVSLTIGSGNKVESIEKVNTGGNGGNGGGFGGSGQVDQGSAATDITEDGTIEGETFTSTGDDENALRVTDATVTLTDVTIDKSAGKSSNTEDGDFYGMNAAFLATDGANVTLTGSKVTSSAQNGNGVFCYGTNTVVNVSDCEIVTQADNSGGIQTTGGGTTNASNLTVETNGSSAAAIRSDRGGGTVKVDGGTYVSNGANSPAVYSTADIAVANAELTANGSEALVIEGKNSIALTDCAVVGNMSSTKGSSSSENVHNVMIYQSMSGDADVGTSSFTMQGGTLTALNGDMFYVTNTHAIMELSGVELTCAPDTALLRVVGNSAERGWGKAGANGAQLEFTARSQQLAGDIVVDTISTLDFTLAQGSVFQGSLNIVDNAQGGTAVDGNANVIIEEGCTWVLTGDCTVSTLQSNGDIDFNGFTITLADGTVLS